MKYTQESTKFNGKRNLGVTGYRLWGMGYRLRVMGYGLGVTSLTGTLPNTKRRTR